MKLCQIVLCSSIGLFTSHLFIAGLDYNESICSLVFSGNSTQFVVVSVMDDDILESPETFCGRLNVVGIPTPNVHLDPAKAVATIIDDNGVYTCKECLYSSHNYYYVGFLFSVHM